MITTVGKVVSAILRDVLSAPSGRAGKLIIFLFNKTNSDPTKYNSTYSSARPEGVLNILKDASRRIANIVVYIILLSSFSFPATINLKLTTLDGAQLEQAGVGQPFLLNVVVINTSNSAQYPTLKGIDNLHVRQSGFQMNMVNGATSVTYHYRVRIDTPGEYTLGPANIVEQNNTIESDPIKVTVGTEQKSRGSRAQKAAAQAPTMKLVCDKTQVYVGQKINAELSFLTPDPTTVLQSIIEPELTAGTGLVFKNKQAQPITGTEKINGIEHRFARWNFQIIPTKPGTLVLPAYAAQYTSQANQPMLSFFFHQDIKKVFSNTMPLDVLPLPPSQKTPAFIGTINQITAQINPVQARVGEGMVLSLNLTGQGDFESIGMAPVILPEQLKWYESKHTYTPCSTELGTYSMEYIVQALQPGTITIPKQDFFYFDTNSKRYKTISSTPITISITGTATSEQTPSSLPSAIDTQAPINPLAALNQDGPIQDTPERMIPWYLFWLLLSILGLLWLIYLFLSMNKKIVKNILSSIFRKRVSFYKAAREQINKAYQKKDFSSYYFYLNQLFAQRLQTMQAQVTPEIIENSLRQDGLSAQAVEDWRSFYEEISQMSFYKPNLDAQYYKEITQKTYYWIDVLEQLPRVHL